MRVVGWRCPVCAARVDVATSFPWRCPNSTAHDRRHVLQIVEAGGPHDDRHVDGPDERADEVTSFGFPVGSRPAAEEPAHANAFIRHDADLAWAAHAQANGIDADARRRLVEVLDEAVRSVAGTGFEATPFGRSAALSDALGFTDGGGVWVKDETGGVGGSQKARHLFTILLHLRTTELLGQLTDRPPLAIASCGNAALAAATLAQAAEWPLDVYVPTWMSDGFGNELDRLGARVHRCERRTTDPAGDPAMFRFREAVAAGAIPFTVQGPENALALDGGRTLGWEIGEQLAEQGGVELDRIFVQVGGGAFAACVGATHPARRFVAVQAAGCAPFARAWDRAGGDVHGGSELVAPGWAALMTPWENPHSLADGILDDETYDWLGVIDAISGASAADAPVVAEEADIVAAHQLARAAGFDVSPTGSAGLAGLLAVIESVQPTERVAVVMSGVAR
jgi:threonine synthase